MAVQANLVVQNAANVLTKTLQDYNEKKVGIMAQILGKEAPPPGKNTIPSLWRKHNKDDPETVFDKTVLFKQRGVEKKRNFGKIPPWVPKIGKTPVEFSFINKGAQDWREVVRASIDAYKMVQRRAPVVSGAYRRSIRFAVTFGGKDLQELSVPPTALLKRMEKYSEPGHAIGIYPSVESPKNFPYGQWVEYYHGATDRNWVGRKGRSSYYNIVRNKQKKGGILRYVALRIARKYPDVAVRFSYMQTGTKGGGTFPFIFVAPKGTFANRFEEPGAYKAYRTGWRKRRF